MRFTVAIDGPAAAGKGTIARALSREFGFKYLDTGLLYRAVGRAVLDGADAVDAARALTSDALEVDGLRTADVGQAASKAAAIPEVRDALFDFQRAFAHRLGGAVLDGRDIGTVICPGAEVKLFVTASDAARARRRWLELTGAGQTITEAEVLSALRERDARDADRATAPMLAAPDATRIDTSDLTIEDAVATAAALVTAKLEPH
ncbi:MAG: (d)CMP kinase [Pseudomonadota bacterium]